MDGIIAKSAPSQILPPTKGARKLAKGEWRNITWAKYVKLPLENCEGLGEGRLVGELAYISAFLAPVLGGCRLGSGL